MISCENCFVHFSPQWRKIDGLIYCNACKCYFDRYGKHRDELGVYAKILCSLKKI